MHVRSLHSWNVTPREAIALQRRLADDVRQESLRPVRELLLIAGTDVSSTKDSPLLTAGVVVWNRETGEVVEAVSAQADAPFPYVPGLLSFREVPHLAQLLATLRTMPDAILVDGHGRAHPRRLGIAAHLGLLVDIPTVGVAKSRLCGTFEPPAPSAGSTSPLHDRGEQIGTVVRTRGRVSPVFVSPGNHITLEDAIALTLACTRGYRLPEPTRLAHTHVNAVRMTGRGLAVTASLQQPLL